MKEVVFDGINLALNVDGVRITNGRLPDVFTVTESYEISAESLTKLIVALGDGNTCAELIESVGYGASKKTHILYALKDTTIKKVTERVLELEKKNASLQEDLNRERRKASDEGYKRYLLEKVIDEHNKRTWWGRMENIELMPEK